MDRELLLLLLCALASGPALLIAGRLRSPTAAGSSGRALERAAWRALWTPLLPVSLVIATLAGWALREPAAAEGPPAWVWVAALPGVLLWLRGLRGAVGDLLMPVPPNATGTLGILRPRVQIAAALDERLDPVERAAVRLHEAAHARHFDPLRIWFARAVTVLQGDTEAAQGRLGVWLVALELARDEEARVCGADGVALARALVAAARLPAVGAGLTGNGEALRTRVQRLLAPVPDDWAAPPLPHWPMFAAASLIGAFMGEPLIQWLLA